MELALFVSQAKAPLTAAARCLVMAILLCGINACVSHPAHDEQNHLPAGWLADSWQHARDVTPVARQVETTIFSQIQSAQLQDLIDQALNNNFALEGNRLDVLAFALASKQVDGQRLPDIQLQGQADREKALYEEEPLYTKGYALGLVLEWELDLWGRLHQQSLAQRAELDAMRADYQAARQSLIALVTRTYLDMWQLSALLELQRQRLAIYTELQQIAEEQYKSGLSNLQDWSLAALQVQETQVRVTALEEQFQASEMQLAVLLGKTPGPLNFSATLPDIRSPVLSVPAMVLVRRPDVQAAFQRLMGKGYEKTAQYRALLPTISLSANTARKADRLGGLGGAETVWALVGGISQSLLLADLADAGPLSLARATSIQEQAEKQRYLQVVLDAMLEVENALLRERSLVTQGRQLQQAVKLADELYQDYRARYQSGLVNLLDLLTIQEQSLAAREALLENQAQHVHNRVLLGLAMGLGEPDSVAKAKENTAL
ncbi:TolC family protein [Bowmanella denitrificans]|uniref:TolC family protein n=1 Tax=Bowmanella denitrificans TaxID=366582 RepID=UPI000C9CE706|nr:TolC family protein [Bowmanella denitrificans]